MSEIQPDQPADDTEGHLKHRLVDDGAEETDDTEGHKVHRFDGADDEDDTEGHMKHR